VPVRPIGKLTLDRNPDNFFAETEQAAFHPGPIVPGIDFSNDPLLQGRLFSYTDTQLLRLGGPNFHQIPINRPVCPFHNNQRDAYHQHQVHKGRASYEPNSIDSGWPKETPAGPAGGGFESYPERIEGHKIRNRSESFGDHFSQARLFWKSMSEVEQAHIVDAYSFELGKVERMAIREREVTQVLANIDLELARRVAANIGVPAPTAGTVALPSVRQKRSPSLSQENLLSGTIRSRKIAILVADGVDAAVVSAAQAALKAEGAVGKLVAPSLAPVKGSDGNSLLPDGSLAGLPSIMFDAVLVPGGEPAVQAMAADGTALHYVLEAYKHLKAIALLGEAKSLPGQLRLDEDEGLLVGADLAAVLAPFINAIARHRVWTRMAKAMSVPA